MLVGRGRLVGRKIWPNFDCDVWVAESGVVGMTLIFTAKTNYPARTHVN